MSRPLIDFNLCWYNHILLIVICCHDITKVYIVYDMTDKYGIVIFDNNIHDAHFLWNQDSDRLMKKFTSK